MSHADAKRGGDDVYRPRIHSLLRLAGFWIAPLSLGFYLFYCFVNYSFWPLPWEGFEPPDDVTQARQLLAEKQSGPGYFTFTNESPDVPFPFVAPGTASGQIDRILQERHLDPSQREKIEKMIIRLTESTPSRIKGSDLVNVLRLNIALDEMPVSP